MADNKPAQQDRKARYLAPFAIAAVFAAVLIATVVTQQPKPAAPLPAPVPAPPAAQTVPKAAPQPLTRADLINHARSIAATFAANGKLPEAADLLIGRPFSVRLVFGCNGISGTSLIAQASLAYDSNSQSVALVARPGDWTSLPLIQGLPDAASIESVEGFWFTRPWMDKDGCPARSSYFIPATPTPPTAPSLGLAQIFRSGGSRFLRHADHPYEYTRKIPADATDLLNHSYRLVLEGIVSGFANHQALQCWAESSDHQPLCVYGVTLNRVMLLDGDTGEVLATWTD